MIKKLKSIKKYKIISLVIVICLIFFIYNTPTFKQLYNDILFFKLFDTEKNKEQNEITQEYKNIRYIFDVSYKKTDTKNIFLYDTVKNESLIEDMLAPGTEGEFDIVLTTNSNTRYQVKFNSLSSKPYNLKFQNLETKETVNNLEELNLEGTLQKNTLKSIPIHWYWNYENTKEGNIQDTIDSKKIKNYEFSINTVGEQWR